MRTTLTLDDDVSVQIERLRRARDASLKEVVNDVLRRGLRETQAPAKKRKPFETRPINGVKSTLDNLDNTAEIIAIVEGELYK